MHSERWTWPAMTAWRTHAWSLVLGACVLFTASSCVSADPDDGSQLPAPVSKDEARSLGGKHDSGADLCAANGWYGDGACDDFCVEPDPDCAQRGIWIWDDRVVLDPAEQAAFFAFAGRHRVRAAYVHAEGLVAGHPRALAAFIDRAAASNIETELLFGAPGWARAEEHERALDLAEAAIRFSEGLPAARPSALQFDIEPYALPEWNDGTSRLANEYLDLVEQLGALTSGSSLRLHLCVPFWFDSVMVTRSGGERPLSELLADRAQRLVIMDYRDEAGPIVDLASEEMAYAGQNHGEVVLGVETQCALEPETVTFCEEGSRALEEALGQVVEAYADHQGFAGVAVHHYGAYVTLRP